MATFDNTYSRFVTGAKIILPLIALGLLSTLFLFSRGIDQGANIPYADVDVEEIARDQRLSAPNFSGTTDDGTAISVAADVAMPDLENPKRMIAEGLSAIIDLRSGASIQMQSLKGSIDSEANIARFSGGVTLTTSTGYLIETDAVTAALMRTDVTTDGQVSAVGPMGEVTAGQMTLKSQPGLEDIDLVFKNGVKLIYTPDR